MDVEFFGQPYEGGLDLRDFLLRVQADGGIDGMRAAVAWGKRSGLGRVADIFSDLKARKSGVELIVGISEGGATHQGLELAIGLATRAYVFHDFEGRTFHPKIYLAKGPKTAHLLVGSHNLTKGGLFSNYEAGLACRLDLRKTKDAALASQVDSYLDRLVDDSELCKPLSRTLLTALVADARYRIGDEDRPSKGSTGSDDDSDSVQESRGQERIFGKSSKRRRQGIPAPGGKPTPSAKTKPTEAGDTRGAGVSGTNRSGRPKPRSSVAVAKRWFKKMRATDAQRPPKPNSNVTGNLRLSQARHPIDWTTYFRDDFFDCATWIPELSKPTEEYCLLDFDVSIRGKSLGVHSLRVDHLPSRMASQSNVPTVLKWGDLSASLRKVDHVGDWVVLERLTDDSFRLEVRRDSPGPFIA